MLRTLAVLLTFGFASLSVPQAAPALAGPSWQDPQQDQPQYQDQDQSVPYDNFSPEQLDNLLSPIALYPDPLLAQVFVAATFPDQVEEAARYVRGYGQNGIDDQYWDVSVKAVAHYPTVIGMMADRIDWTTTLGQAYVNQSTDVAMSVQHLRHLAREAGNLASTPQQEVLVNGDYIAITPYQPQYIYVPVYDPAIIYYRRPYFGPAITFGVAFPIGAWLNLDFRWGYGGGWGGVYYTGWRREGWGGGCWNCGWIARSRSHVTIINNVYVNNRYERVTVNRTVVRRTVNVNNIDRYNYVHRDVRYDNVRANNDRFRGNGRAESNRRPDVGRPDNRPGADYRPGEDNRPREDNRIIDRNIDRNNPRLDQYRGRDNNIRDDRQQNPARQYRPNPPNNENLRNQNRMPNRTQAQPAPPAVSNGPHTFNKNESHFDPRMASQRGQASRQQAARPQPAARPPERSRQEGKPHGGGERKKP